jgi:hypothetical protein
MNDTPQVHGQRIAAEYLRELLLKPGRYRDAWHQRVARPRDGVINQMAVAEVIGDYLRSSPDGRPAASQMIPHQLRVVISEALSGRQLSLETLALFADAFGFTAHEADRLRRLRTGSTRIRILSGREAVSAERELTDVLGPRLHQTLSLHDHVYIGSDRRIDRVRLLQVIEAIVPGVDRIPFLCDTNVLTIEVGQGGKELSGDVRQIRAGIFYTDILLSRTLDLGETITLEYWVTYRFPGDQADPSEREYRRGVLRQAANVDVRVEFSQDRLPTGVWWARWDGAEGEIVDEEEVTLDGQNSVQRFLHSVEKTVVGFRWSWDLERTTRSLT